MSVIDFQRARGLATITIEDPPVNAVSVGGGVVDGLSAALAEALADASVQSRTDVAAAGR